MAKWAQVSARSSRTPRSDTIRAAAIAIEGCTDAYVRSFALANLARVALRDGDLEAASTRLAAARAAVKEPRGIERIAHLELEGRIALARGRAVRAFGVLARARASRTGRARFRVARALGK